MGGLVEEDNYKGCEVGGRVRFPLYEKSDNANADKWSRVRDRQLDKHEGEM